MKCFATVCLAAMAALVLLVGGCSSSGNSPAPSNGTKGGLTFNIAWPEVDGRNARVIPDSTNAITVQVFKNNVQVGTTTLPRQEGQATVTAHLENLPVGSVVVEVRALNTANEVIAMSGVIDETVVANASAQVDIALHLPISGTFGVMQFGGPAGVVNAATGEYTMVGNTVTCAYVAPNGKQLLVNSFQDDNKLQLLNLDGSTQTRIISDPTFMVQQFAYSNDGTLIAFSASVFDPMTGQTVYNVYLVNADGSNLRNLTNYTMSDASGMIFDVRISPDKQTVIFGRIPTNGNGMPIWRVGTDGTGLAELIPSENYLNYPIFTPDGSKIVFTENSDMYMVNADGTNKTLVAAMEGFETPAAFSADGTWLAFNAGTNYADGDLYVMKLDGSHKIRLTHMQGIICKSWASAEPTGVNFNIF